MMCVVFQLARFRLMIDLSGLFLSCTLDFYFGAV